MPIRRARRIARKMGNFAPLLGCFAPLCAPRYARNRAILHLRDARRIIESLKCRYNVDTL